MLQQVLRCWYVLSSFRFFPAVTPTFSKYILWHERWQWSLLPLNLFPWHQKTDISVSIWFWLHASGCYSKKMRVFCLTPSIDRLQSFSSTEFLEFSTAPVQILLVAVVFISYFSIVGLFQWPQFSWEIVVGDFFQWVHQQLKKKDISGFSFMKVHIQIIHIPFTSPCFLISRCLWRCGHTQQQTLYKR